MNRLLILVLFVLTACENVHNISIINNTDDTLMVKVYPPISEWTYTLNCLNGYIDFEIDTINGDSTIKYSPVGKFMTYNVFPNANFILESAEGLPLSESSLMLDKFQINNQKGKRILNLRNKKQILQSCFQSKEERLSETEFIITID